MRTVHAGSKDQKGVALPQQCGVPVTDFSDLSHKYRYSKAGLRAVSGKRCGKERSHPHLCFRISAERGVCSSVYPSLTAQPLGAGAD